MQEWQIARLSSKRGQHWNFPLLWTVSILTFSFWKKSIWLSTSRETNEAFFVRAMRRNITFSRSDHQWIFPNPMVNVMAHSTSNWPHLSMIFPYTLQSVFNLISVSYLLVRCAFLEGHRKDLEELYTSMLLLQESAPVFPKSTHSVPQVPAQPSQPITTIKKKNNYDAFNDSN